MTYFVIGAFFTGFPVGLLLSLSLGPVFFTLIQSSIENGFKSALFIALGVIFGDLILLTFAYSGVRLLFPSQDVRVKEIAEIGGGILLTVMGASTLLKKKKPAGAAPGKRTKRNYAMDAAKGTALNLLNPANLFAWTATSAYLNAVLKYNHVQTYSFYAGCLVATYAAEAAVGFFAKSLKKIMNDRMIRLVNLAIGCIFIGCGVLLFLKAVKG